MSLEIKNISVEYSIGDRVISALEGLSLDVPLQRYTLGVVGESGSGKTTLGMSIIGAIESPGRVSKGSIEYEGTNVLSLPKKELMHYQWEKVSMIYQSAMNSLHPVKRVKDPIVEVLREHKKISKREATEVGDLSVRSLHWENNG